MSAAASGSLGPAIRSRDLAARDSLTEDILRGLGDVTLPLASALGSAPGPRTARLGPEAFGVSGTETADRLARVLAGEGFVVSTGHQPILFLGPLYVLYKALTAIELARRLESSWGVPVVPLFWIASDDHDWAEVAAATLLDREGATRTLRLHPSEEHAGRPVGPAPLGEAVADRIADVRELVPESEFTPIYLDYILDSYRPDRSFSAGFSGLLERVLGPREYAWLDADGAEVKTAAAEWFEEMLVTPETYLAAARDGASRMRDAGHEPPIPELENALPLFFDTGERRERLYISEDGVRAGKDGQPESVDRWRDRLRSRADAFSPNVSSRPVLESRLLPVAATVLGPGEIAYWSQLPATFEAAGVPFPAVQPRAAWTLIEPRIQKLLDRFEIEPEGLADGGDDAVSQLTRRSRPEAVDTSLAELRGALGAGLGAVDTAVGEALPGLRGAVGKTRKAVFDALDELAKQVDQETRQRLDTQIAQIRRCAANLFPDRRPQERTLSPFYFLTRYGPDLVDDLEQATRAWVADSLAGPDSRG